MDRTTAHNAIRAHQPSRWWVFLGLNRCRSRDCNRRWPCDTWLHARDERDRADREQAANYALMLITRLHPQAAAGSGSAP